MIVHVYPLPLIRDRLARHDPEAFRVHEHTRQAAVAVILRDAGEADGTQILFIKRAEKQGDPWSGHMAFPGGHKEPDDVDLKSAAMRETFEEIGLDLAAADYLGALDQQRAMPRGRPLNMLIAPHVFSLEGDPAFTPNYEVDEVVWTRLAPLVSGERHDWETRPMAGRPTVFNGYRLEGGHFVWGLTYRMLKSFFATLDPAWEAPPER
ncbi:MAG: CoA pyrophosphatase [Pseudomonadales bacterium]